MEIFSMTEERTPFNIWRPLPTHKVLHNISIVDEVKSYNELY
jgi:hypothetical protein